MTSGSRDAVMLRVTVSERWRSADRVVSEATSGLGRTLR